MVYTLISGKVAQEGNKAMTTNETTPTENLSTKDKNPRMTRRTLIKLGIFGGATLGTAAIIKQLGLNPIDSGEAVRKKIHDNVTQQNINSGAYDMAPPPDRVAESTFEVSDIKNLFTIPETDSSIPEKFSGFPQFHSRFGFDAYMDGLPTRNPAEKTPPQALITGYLVAKEKQPDGSFLFGVELPYLSSPRDILKRNTVNTIPEMKTQDIAGPGGVATESVVGGMIIWLKLFSGTNPTYYPFDTIVTWGSKSFQSATIDPSQPKTGTGDKGLAEYGRIGDPIRARVDLEINFDRKTEVSKGLEAYTSNYGYAATIDQAKNQYQQIIDANMRTAKSLTVDSGKKTPITEQVQDKKYILTPNFVVFLPANG